MINIPDTEVVAQNKFELKCVNKKPNLLFKKICFLNLFKLFSDEIG